MFINILINSNYSSSIQKCMNVSWAWDLELLKWILLFLFTKITLHASYRQKGNTNLGESQEWCEGVKHPFLVTNYLQEHNEDCSYCVRRQKIKLPNISLGRVTKLKEENSISSRSSISKARDKSDWPCQSWRWSTTSHPHRASALGTRTLLPLKKPEKPASSPFQPLFIPAIPETVSESSE